MRFFIFLVSSILFQTTFTQAQSIDELLKEADRILQNKPDEKSKQPSNANTKKMQRDDLDDVTTPQSTQPSLSKIIENTEPADLKGVAEMDIQSAQRRSEASRSPFAAVSLLYGIAQMQSGYGFEKNEDTFTTNRGTLRGGGLEVESSGLGAETYGLRFAASVGYYRGMLEVERLGVYKENQSYTYSMIPSSGYGRLFWRPLSQFEVSAHGGITMELIQQYGNEDTDTSSMINFGPLLGTQVRWTVFDPWSFFMMAERKGLSARASQSSASGNHYAIGTSMNMFL